MLQMNLSVFADRSSGLSVGCDTAPLVEAIFGLVRDVLMISGSCL